MSKKLISIILTIAVILCQGTLCLGTVYAADDELLVDPVIYSLESTTDVWKANSDSQVQLENQPDGSLKYVSTTTWNSGKGRYDSGWMTTANAGALNINASEYYAVVFDYKMDGVDEVDPWYYSGDTAPQPYMTGYWNGFDTAGNAVNASAVATIDQITLTGTKGSDGLYYSDYVTYVRPLDYKSGGKWPVMSVLNDFRLDAIQNANGTAYLKNIGLLSKPGVVSIGYNSMETIDVADAPVNPETIEINLTHPITAVSTDAITFNDVEGNPVAIEKAALSADGMVVTVTLAQELNPYTGYVLALNENTVAGKTVCLSSPVEIPFTTGEYRVPSILDIIDPNRPIDEEPVHVYRSWEFKDAADIAYFPSLKNGNYVTEHMYGEYMQVSFGTPTINANGNWNGYYTDTDLKGNPLDANVVTHLQVRMKVVNDTFAEVDPQLRFYFAGVKEDGKTSFAMSGATGILSRSEPGYGYQNMYTDENGNYCTDWFVETIDLSSFGAWVDAKTINSIRVCVMENCSGVALVDYIRFIGYVPEVESVTYTDANGTADVTEDVYIPANTKSFEISLTDVVAGLSKENVSLVSEFGTNTAVDSVAVDATGMKLTINLAEELEKSAEYTLTVSPLISGSMLIAKPIVVNFNTELDPLNAKIVKAEDGKSATVTYINATDEDAVLVAIATSWKQAQQAVEKKGKTEYVDIPGRVEYLGKNMTVNSIAAGSTDTATLTFDVDADNGEFVEIVIWKYDTATGEYSVFSKKVN